MLLVKTKLGLSKIHGIGVFADEFIPKGTIVWKFQPEFDRSIAQEDFDKLSDSAKKQFLNYAYINPRTDRYTLCFDDGRFFNHSETPNCGDIESFEDPEGLDIALRDIEIGEELTSDYRDFEKDAQVNFNVQK